MKYDDWLTKEHVAKRLGVSERTVMRLADRKKIRQAMRPREGGSPLAVFNPEDVQNFASKRAAAVSVMPRDAAEPAPGVPMSVSTAPAAVSLTAAFAKRLAFLSASHVPLWLRWDEAAAFSGLGESFLRELVQAGTVKTARGPHGSTVLNRADLERHAGMR